MANTLRVWQTSLISSRTLFWGTSANGSQNYVCFVVILYVIHRCFHKWGIYTVIMLKNNRRLQCRFPHPPSRPITTAGFNSKSFCLIFIIINNHSTIMSSTLPGVNIYFVLKSLNKYLQLLVLKFVKVNTECWRTKYFQQKSEYMKEKKHSKLWVASCRVAKLMDKCSKHCVSNSRHSPPHQNPKVCSLVHKSPPQSLTWATQF